MHKIDTKKALLLLIQDLALLLGISTLFAIPWGFKNYPLQYQWNVFFVLAADTGGADSNTGMSIIKGFVIPTIIAFAVYKCLLYFFVKRKKLLKINATVSLITLAAALSIFTVSTKFWKYFEISKTVLGSAQKSDFYEENFISEENFKIISPDKKRNIIYIFMESMEPGFTSVEKGGILKEDLIPNLTKIAEENISFGDTGKAVSGGINLAGTSWTVAGLLSKTSGVPYFMPFSGEKKCLPNLKKLGDFLYEMDYNLIFSMGSEKRFENRDSVLESQHFEIHDITWYKENKWLPENYQVFWGFEDAKLYNFAKKELDLLGKSEKPFCYALLTVDTHFPDGYTCPLCKLEHKENIENVISCADRQLGSFIEWAKTQEWYENTTIVITGDHCYLDAPLNNFIARNSDLSRKEQEKSRRFLNIFINSKAETENPRKPLNSFDMLPTILEAMGNKIEGKGMYLGRSMFSENKSLSETYDQDTFEKEIMKKTEKYESFK